MEFAAPLEIGQNETIICGAFIITASYYNLTYYCFVGWLGSLPNSNSVFTKVSYLGFSIAIVIGVDLGRRCCSGPLNDP